MTSSPVQTNAATPPPKPPSTARYRVAIAGLLLVIAALLIALVLSGAVAPALSGPVGTSASAEPQPTPSADPERDAFMLSLPRRIEGDPLAQGAVDAPVVMTEWSDYRCPFCAAFAQETAPELQRFVDDGTLRIEFRDLVAFGDDSLLAAAGARAASRQGMFWEYHTALFATLDYTVEDGHPPVDDALVMQIAREVGVPDLDAFEEDYQSEEVRNEVIRDTQEAQSYGLNSTPTFLIGTEVIPGAQAAEVFEQVITQQAAQHG
ncbi:MAG: DsbA family protein [Propioniciclava sp.]